MTTKEVAEIYIQNSLDAQYLWKSAYSDIARICNTYHRERARKMLLNCARQTKGMAISGSYKNAAQKLK